MAFDAQGNLYFAFAAFNSAGFPDVPGPLQENGVFVAKYTNHGDPANYAFTTAVAFNVASIGYSTTKNG